jgi:hypothetical protein
MLKNIIKRIRNDFGSNSALSIQLRIILGDSDQNNREVDAATIEQVVRKTLPQCNADNLQIGTDLSRDAVSNAIIRNCRGQDEPVMTDGGRRRARAAKHTKVTRVPASPLRRRRVARM